jgi:benzoylformate decarboxylase
MATIRDATFDVLRQYGLTTIFANPGSTEVSLLTDLPEDLDFRLALHEGSVVGMATGFALGADRPALAILHTTAGLGNAVGALATARVNRAPLVVVVGQQDRRHLSLEPFLAARRLDEVAGPYPVWVDEPVRAQDVPGAVARAWHEARDGRGPAVVIVPMDDWEAEADDLEIRAPARLVAADAVDAGTVRDLAALLSQARSPALVVGAGADSAAAWKALESLVERLGCPVWQEAFGGRAGFPQDHPRFAGHLPPGRAGLRKTLAGHDVVVAVGAPVFRQYPYEPGPLVEPGTRLAIVTDDPAEAHRSPVELAVLAPVAPVCARLVEMVPARSAEAAEPHRAAEPAEPHRASEPAEPHRASEDPPSSDEPMRAPHVLAAVAERLPRNAVVVEETPSSRPDLHALVPAREPMGFVSAAHGGLGFGLPASLGIRMARPDRPVVAILGDGSTIYGIQALWSAAHYRIGVLAIVLANGRYAIMHELARAYGATRPGGGGAAPWPPFDEVSMHRIAEGFGCPAREVATYSDLIGVLDEVLPTLADRQEPLVLEVVVRP